MNKPYSQQLDLGLGASEQVEGVCSQSMTDSEPTGSNAENFSQTTILDSNAKSISSIEQGYRGTLLKNESLAHFTTWRVGGRAKQIFKPMDRDDLVRFLRELPPEEPVLWLGLGSNALIRDGGFSGTVIVTQGGLKQIECLSDTQVRVDVGVSCASMARFCARNGLTGAEFWAGIPGTMGGALRMNAGCYGSETWSYVESVETIRRDGTIQVRSADSFEVAYRHTQGLAADEWFLSASCRLPPGDKDIALANIKTLLARRAETQPINEYNCGSVFRNPPGDFAARLIESCGLKGKKIGGAVVSEKHANFIINQEGLASAADIEALIHFVRETVMAEKNIQLAHEIHIIGDAI
ncbi:MAG: UDP-N-acetylmuramate dehydrogenase [Legionellaceae bacterium]|nr:UDP-N-acetylmuramate dehydrogenase [Legionellaceae bacterium]